MMQLIKLYLFGEDVRMKYADLIAKLTLEEKAGLTSGLDFWHTKGVERLGIRRK